MTAKKKVAPATETKTETKAPVAAKAPVDAYEAALKRGASYVQLGQFADTIGVSRPTLSNWRQRYDDFPKPALVCGTVELFSRREMAKYAASLNYGDDVVNAVLGK